MLKVYYFYDSINNIKDMKTRTLLEQLNEQLLNVTKTLQLVKTLYKVNTVTVNDLEEIKNRIKLLINLESENESIKQYVIEGFKHGQETTGIN